MKEQPKSKSRRKLFLLAAFAATVACASPAVGYQYILSGDPIAASTNHACIATIGCPLVTGGYGRATTTAIAMRSDEYHAFMLIVR